MLNECFYTLAEGILISVRSLQRSEGDVSDLISMTRRVNLAMIYLLQVVYI